MDKNKHENLSQEKDGELTTHQQITEAYQSGIVDRFTYENSRHQAKRTEKE